MRKVLAGARAPAFFCVMLTRTPYSGLRIFDCRTAACNRGGYGDVLLYFAHEAFVSVVLAPLFAPVLPPGGPIAVGRRAPLAERCSASSSAGVVIAVRKLILKPVQAWFNTAAHTVKLIERKVQRVAPLMAKFDSLRNSAGNTA